MSHWRDFLDAEAPGGRYLPWKEVARATGLSRTTAWRLQKRDDFPAPYALSPGRVAYREQEVEAWRVSRAHPGARVGPAGGRKPASAGAARPPTPAVPQPEAPLQPPEANPPAPAAAPRPGPERASPVPRPTPRLAPKRGKPDRRRSQHAQAIAQQILFDF